jgi:hypothetical protein
LAILTSSSVISSPEGFSPEVEELFSESEVSTLSLTNSVLRLDSPKALDNIPFLISAKFYRICGERLFT